MGADDPSQTVTGQGASRPPALELVRGEVVDKFLVLEPLGAGGMGVVVAAYDPSLDRKVALKLLRPGGEGSGGHARLVREAQSMARLAHPNVVTVYAAGMVGERVYVAMELVGGGTLRRWMRERPRGWREIVAAFIQAGQGLAAAHRAGIIHRDFKPDNVLVGEDGRIRVTDFGLAWGPNHGAADDVALIAPLAIVDGSLTATGDVVGTPSYMAPELRRGPANAASDQFAFCVSLYEGLYGQKPFDPGDERKQTIKPAPADARVPAWLRAAAVRGLSADPAARFPSMDDLLHRLGHDPAVTWRRTALAGLCGAVAAVAIFWPRAPATASCAGADRLLAGIWDPARRDTTREAFTATGAAAAPASFARFSSTLDTYANAWTRTHTQACEATRVRGEQSEVIMDLKMACLGRRLDEAAALVSLYQHPDAPMVAQAALAAHKLARPESCAAVDALSAAAAPPRDPHTAALAAEVGGVMARADALFKAGRYPDARAVAVAALAAARAVGHPPVVAEALYRAGMLAGMVGEAETARALLHQAVTAARAARHDEVEADAWTELVWVLGKDLARYDEALETADLAGAAVSSMRDDGTRRSMLDNFVGEVLAVQGRFDEALAHHRSALARRRQLLGNDSPDVGKSLNNIAGIQYQLGQNDAAAATFRECVAVLERALGPRHLNTGRARSNLGEVLRQSGHLAEAETELEAAADIIGENVGQDSLYVAFVHANLGELYRGRGALAEARGAYDRALAIFQATRGPDHPETAYALAGLGNIAVDAGDGATGVALLERAKTIRVAAKIDPVLIAENDVWLARALLATPGGAARAHALLDHARQVLRDAGQAGASMLAQADALVTRGGARR